MMTQPILMFDSLTSEAAPAGGNALKGNLASNERRLLEMRARYARAELVGNFVSDAILWGIRQAKRLVAAIKENHKLRIAEAQLFRMSDRELSDLGLCRADIHFAVREAAVEGVTPSFDTVAAEPAVAANRNETPSLFWAGRA